MIVLKTPKKPTIVYLVVCSGLVVAGVVVLLLPSLPGLGPSPASLRVAAGAVALLCAVGAGLLITKGFDTPIALVIDRKGILEATSAGRFGWEDIVRVGVVTVNGKKSVGIEVRKSAGAEGKARTTRILKKGDDASGYSFILPESSLDRPAEKVAALLERYLKDKHARRELRNYTE